MILYLHGFRSSPQSFKARLIVERMHALGQDARILCPQLPSSPAAAVALARQLVQDIPSETLTVIGSSLGGFYATWLAEHLGCRAVLLNPAVKPQYDLEQQVGVTSAYHSDEPFEFRQEYIAELEVLAVPAITRPERYFLLAATGDEVLNWHDMVRHYPHARQTVIAGSDHGLADFSEYMEEVMEFCGIAAPEPA